MEIRTILVAMDLSQDLDDLAEVASTMARAHAATLVLVHVAPGEPDFVGYPKPLAAQEGIDADMTEDEIAFRYGVGYAYDRHAQAEQHWDRHRALHEVREKLEAQGIKAQSLMLEGMAADKILSEAEKLGADLLITGSHQHSRIGELVFGSTSREILRRAPCPVVVVPPRHGRPSGNG